MIASNVLNPTPASLRSICILIAQCSSGILAAAAFSMSSVAPVILARVSKDFAGPDSNLDSALKSVILCLIFNLTYAVTVDNLPHSFGFKQTPLRPILR